MLIINTLVGWLVALPHPKNFVVSLPRWSRFRFCTVEALCRDALSHSTPHTSLRSSCERCTVEKCSRPAVMQKVRETAQQPLTPLLRKKQHHSFPASLFCLLLPQKNLGVVLTTDSFTHPLPMLHKPTSSLFLRTLPQRVLAGLAHMDFARAKPRQQCRTPYANQFVQRPSLLLRRTAAQTAQLLAVTPLASNK